MNIYLNEDNVYMRHVTEPVNGKRKTHDRPATDEEIAKYQELLVQQARETLEKEHQECIDFLDATFWVYAKQMDGKDIQKHQDIINQRVATRERMDEIQEILQQEVT